jgi:hypothetical protein
MTQYVKLPLPVPAIVWDGDCDVANRVLGERYGVDWEYVSADSLDIWIPTLEGRLTCRVGAAIMTGVKGEHWAIDPEVFARTYVAITDRESSLLKDPSIAREVLAAGLLGLRR